MATSSAISSSTLLPTRALTSSRPINHRSRFADYNQHRRTAQRAFSFKVRAAKLPAGLELPKVDPKFKAPFLGFTKTAEIWNSRACMIGLIGTFIVELIFNKSILQMIGVDVGKGLDIPI
ncbi:hypothetical protein HHK36_011045 [Tetracentron sinense]|uniref:Uncharacterized protein n=1 Tax=Tetracentron sinense TaxID=13715 RepID=A0A834ZHZ3_TETSI|nr:hypothetical protein HHK36_011045 [Tetracentron sinense]